MELDIYIEQSVEQNASLYFEKAKKQRKKIDGATEALLEIQKKIDALSKKTAQSTERVKTLKRDKEWYEKFRFMFTSEGKLVIGGRDATTNDIVIKKHMEDNDLVFHADIAGSPFCVVKGGKDSMTEEEIEEVASFCGSNSKAFKTGMSTVEVFYVTSDQVSMDAPSGEYLQKGSFMIYGKKNKQTIDVNIAVGLYTDGKVMAGHIRSVKAHTTCQVVVAPGKHKKSDIAKKIQKYFKYKTKMLISLDDIMQVLPAGDGDVISQDE